ncbi:MAG: spondin domain-containing protein [Candidatus Eremiobacteraeota bacterium]|nr:spondin domain-containing protein [Candidatus Eremiobacteraeota bacterium]
MMSASHNMMMASGSCKSAMAAMHDRMMAGALTHCFKVRIDNISAADEFTASNGTKWSLPFSPGVFAVSSKGNPIFATGARDRKQGLRSLSEDGDPFALATYVEHAYPGSGAFLVPVGGTKPKGILPGESFEFYADAQPGQQLYLVTMNGQSNDWFYGTPFGIKLFDASGKPLGGDVTSNVKLYDAGTEADQELGIGSTQGPRQPHPRYGPDDPNPIVRLATSDARFIDVTKVMRVTVTPQ